MKKRMPQTVHEVQQLLHHRIRPLPAETVSVLSAYRRVPTEIPCSPVNLPDFEKSAMDGYALRAVDSASATASSPARLHVEGESIAGQAPRGSVGASTAMKITTGAALPPGADAVVPVEGVLERPEGFIELVTPIAAGKHVIRVGEDLKVDSPVLPQASLTRPLRAQDIALLVAVGIPQIRVARRPRVCAIVTGNELLRPGSRPRGVQIVDSNSPMLAAFCERDGGIWRGVEYAPDEPAAIRDRIARADADVLLVCGGTSVGPRDHAAEAVESLGELAVHGVRVRPGAPVGIGFLSDERIAFLLPGNPVACLCTYDLFAGLTIRRLGSRSNALPYREVQARLTKTVRSEVGRVDYIRVRLHQDHAEPIPGGASRLSTVVHADGFCLIPEEQAELSAGESIPVWLY